MVQKPNSLVNKSRILHFTDESDLHYFVFDGMVLRWHRFIFKSLFFLTMVVYIEKVVKCLLEITNKRIYIGILLLDINNPYEVRFSFFFLKLCQLSKKDSKRRRENWNPFFISNSQVLIVKSPCPIADLWITLTAFGAGETLICAQCMHCSSCSNCSKKKNTEVELTIVPVD